MAGQPLFESPRFILKSDTLPSAARETPGQRRAARAPFPVVVGCPRSGTSLLAVMLDSHPLLTVPPETAFVGHIATLQGPPAAVRQRFFDIVTTDRITVSNWADFGL